MGIFLTLISLNIENRDAKADYFLHPYLSEFDVASNKALVKLPPAEPEA